jgi:hypothetical protein
MSNALLSNFEPFIQVINKSKSVYIGLKKYVIDRKFIIYFFEDQTFCFRHLPI